MSEYIKNYHNENKHCDYEYDCDYEYQLHVHEYLGSTRIAEAEEDPHNHRFCGVTGEAIPCKGSHVHKLLERTDFYENHHHIIKATTGPAIDVGCGRHVHLSLIHI